MPADPQHPVSPGGTPGPGRWSDWDSQEDILAEELAAFPPEDEPDWEALEEAGYSGDASDDEPPPAGPPSHTDPGAHPWPAGRPSAHPGGSPCPAGPPGAYPGPHPGGTAAAGDRAAPTTPNVPGVPGAGPGFAHGGRRM